MTLRLATPVDIPPILGIEQIPEYREYIGAWSEDEHRAAMGGEDAEYLILQSSSEDGEARADGEANGNHGAVEGFAILQGVTSPHRAILLKRIAVRTPGRGMGRALVRFAMERAFVVHRAHRLWLDVFVTNTRARHTYAQLGFQEEGVLRDAILLDGEYQSQVLMSLLEGEYFARQQSVPGTVTGAAITRN